MLNQINLFIKSTIKNLALFLLGFHFSLGYGQIPEEHENLFCESRALDFDTAVRLTLEKSLILNQEWNAAQGVRGLVEQASLYPNPAFAYDVQGSQKGWKERQDVYAINQLVELGGKRQKQIKVATYEYYAALTGYEISKLERLNHLSKAFIRVVAAQELAQLALEHQKNAEEGLKLISGKVEGGKASLIQLNKARVALSLANLNFKKSIAEFRASKNSLCLLWSQTSPNFETVTYPFFELRAPSSLQEHLSKLCEQPEITQSLYRSMAAHHQLRVEKAGRIPDVTLTVGYGYDKGDKGIVAGVMLPLPLWDRNQGNIQKAYHEILKTEDKSKQLKLYLEIKLSNTYVELTRAYHEVEDLEHLILQTSDQTLALAQEGYREGKLEYWEVLSAQQFLLDMKEKYIQALVHYHNKQADIDYLTSDP